jgi:hypothetical protein
MGIRSQSDVARRPRSMTPRLAALTLAGRLTMRKQNDPANSTCTPSPC